MAIYKRALHGLKSDASLLRAYARGDASAFDVFYARHKDTMFHYLCSQISPRTAAEEVAQEVWMAVISNATTFEERGNARSWIYAIAYRRIADHWRKHYSEAEHIDTGEGALDEALKHASTSGHQESEQFAEELRQGIHTLPEEQRQSFLLREQGFSYQEIADITGTGAETVKSRLRYAKSTLREYFGEIHA